MALITLEEAKTYLRVDTSDDDALIGVLLESAEQLCADVARMSDEQLECLKEDYDCDDPDLDVKHIHDVMQVAVLYALGYLYEHREEADHHDLVMTLRSLLFTIREGAF